jgi:hypothetical protein
MTVVQRACWAMAYGNVNDDGFWIEIRMHQAR